MQTHSSHAQHAPMRLTRTRVAVYLTLLLILTTTASGRAQDAMGSNKQPFSFGPDQSLVDLHKLVWQPIKSVSGAEVARLSGGGKTGGEVMVRLAAHTTFPMHNHTSDETYVWITGSFTYVAEDGTAIDLSGQAYVSLPGGVPHALICGDTPCLVYVRHSRASNMRVFPMPELKK